MIIKLVGFEKSYLGSEFVGYLGVDINRISGNQHKYFRFFISRSLNHSNLYVVEGEYEVII